MTMMKLKPKGNSTVGTGSGPSAQRRRDVASVKEEPNRLLGFRIPLSEHQMIGVAAKLEGMSIKDFCMKEIAPKAQKVLAKHGLRVAD